MFPNRDPNNTATLAHSSCTMTALHRVDEGVPNKLTHYTLFIPEVFILDINAPLRGVCYNPSDDVCLQLTHTVWRKKILFIYSFHFVYKLTQ